MTREQKYEAAFNALLDDLFYPAEGKINPCAYCPVYSDPAGCPAVYELDEDIPFADYCIHDDVCREILLQYYIAKGVGKTTATAEINEE